MGEQNEQNNLVERPPVVVILGHVDHGKTTLLDTIRKTKITEEEAGGITQTIGAYEIVHQGKKITFIDTPGHQAFKKMRAFGAKVADVAVLIVAADEGPKEQTLEAFNYIKEAGIPVLVAINKIDRPQSDVLKTKNQLSKVGIYLEGFGGEIPSIEISAKQEINIDQLLDLILLLGGFQQLKADPKGPAKGLVIESFLDYKRGNTATLIIKNGTLHRGQFIGTFSSLGKVKILEDFLGKKVESLTFSSPARVVGFETLPLVGEEFFTSFDFEEVKNFKKEKETKRPITTLLENPTKESLIFRLILKAKSLGALEALKEIVKSVQKEFYPKIVFEIVKENLGVVSEGDLKLAKTSKAIILAFDTKKDFEKELLELYQPKIIESKIIYEIQKNLERELNEILKEEKEKFLGEFEILKVFSSLKKRKLIGGKVISGEIKINQEVRIFSDDKELGGGKILNLRKLKKDIKIAKEGEEIGILLESEIEVKEGFFLRVLK
ncbi:translation initiation factor IF-2 [bacterium]|nr:translation initiation factor IF-2 [bacterium]